MCPYMSLSFHRVCTGENQRKSDALRHLEVGEEDEYGLASQQRVEETILCLIMAINHYLFGLSTESKGTMQSLVVVM